MSLNKKDVPIDSAAIILSLEGLTVTDAERDIFTRVKPLGFILFARNIDTPDQVRALTTDLKSIVGWDCPITIDQEGGRVARLKPPHWRAHPPCKAFGDTACEDLDTALQDLRFRTLRIAEELLDIGINANCDPCVDVHQDGAHDVIGDRAFSSDPAVVGRLGVSVCRHYLAAGITPIMKHIPGHGRSMADSHHDLPVVDTPHATLSKVDFEPFKIIANSDVGHAVWGMTAHIIYSDIDGDRAATVSRAMIDDIIRGEIGFDGFLVSDDLGMKALDVYGDLPARTHAVLDAGCDAALYCAGKLDEMQKIAESVPKLTDKAGKRLQNAQDFSKIAA